MKHGESEESCVTLLAFSPVSGGTCSALQMVDNWLLYCGSRRIPSAQEVIASA